MGKVYTPEDAVPLVASEPKSRITMNTNVVFQAQGEQPFAVQDSCWSWIETKEEPWSRRLPVNDQGMDLLDKHCWVDKPGLIVVSNLTGAGRTIQATPEQLAEDAKKILCIYSTGDMRLLVPPGWTFPLLMEDYSVLRIRCLHGSTHFRLNVFPK